MIKLDGGLSTALERLGANLKTILWTGDLIAASPHLIEQAHLDFIRAGAEIITTASYQISFIGEQTSGLQDTEVSNLLRSSTKIAQSAREKAIDLGHSSSIKVAASIGPYGAALGDGSEYRGHYEVSEKVLRDFHLRRIAVLLESQPDLFAVETIPSIIEAQIVQEILMEMKVPYWISFSCKDEKAISEGDSFAEAISSLQLDKNLIAAGVNCSNPSFIASLLESVNQKSKPEFIVYPNLGRSWDAKKKVWIGEAVQFQEVIPSWQKLGAKYIGGCCGIGPAELSEINLN